MYTYQRRVSFQEAPNGVLTDFTTTDPFWPESLVIVQGALVWTDFTCPDTTTVRFGTAPLAVAEAGELLIATGLFGEGAFVYPVGPWDAAVFQQERGLSSLALSVLVPALEDADTVVQDYILATVYADAILPSPTQPIVARKVKKAIGDLAMVYLRQQNLIAPQASTYSESYSGIVSYALSSSGAATAGLTQTETTILATLFAYRKPITWTPCPSWGTGRFIGVAIDDDEEEEEA